MNELPVTLEDIWHVTFREYNHVNHFEICFTAGLSLKSIDYPYTSIA